MTQLCRKQMRSRRAIVLVVVVVALGVAGLLLAHDLRETISIRRQSQRHEQMVQTRLLAKSVALQVLEIGLDEVFKEGDQIDFKEDFAGFLVARVDLVEQPSGGYSVSATMARSVLVTSQTKHTIRLSAGHDMGSPAGQR
ncbi:MAG: hypothetical protein AAF664_01720 [Planctomycetota bacterium]